MDIKTAFLQSKELDWLVYLDPSKEANVPPGYIWKLSNCVYGLTDASRSWYLEVYKEVIYFFWLKTMISICLLPGIIAGIITAYCWY